MIAYQKYDATHRQIKIGSGFFTGWPDPPDQARHREILARSYLAIVAVDQEKDQIVGFINAISDGVLSAYIPLLEVLPDYQGQGIGSRLVRNMLDALHSFYMVDLCCDQQMQGFYEKFGMVRSFGMIFRNYASQSAIKQHDDGQTDRD